MYFVVPGIINRQHLNKSATHLSKFSLIDDINAYEEAMPKSYFGEKKQKHAVLLLHGYSASPQEFDFLAESLRNANIPFYAPLMTGFGLNRFNLLENAVPADWLRDGVQGYELLSNVAEEVSILGHSTGSNVAVYLASHYKVKYLILSGANLFIGPDDAKYKKILQNPLLAPVVKHLIPMFEKPTRTGRITNTDTLDPVAAERCFHYSSLPIESLEAVWRMQDIIDLRKAEFEELFILYGERDITVDVDRLLYYLGKHSIQYTPEGFANSGHNIFEDYEKDDVVRSVVKILQGQRD
jgi:carboxylesterase